MEWRNMDVEKDIQLTPEGNYFKWEDCTIGFTCKCGADLCVDSQGEPVICECGRMYRLVSLVQVKAVE